MEHIFVEALNRSIAAGWAILAVTALRLLIRRAPKWISCLLWAVVAVRLVCPFSLESVFSLVPSRETVRSDAAVLDGDFVDSGIQFLDDAVNPAIRHSFGSSAMSGAGLNGDVGTDTGTGIDADAGMHTVAGIDADAGMHTGTGIDADAGMYTRAGTGADTGMNPLERVLSAAGILWLMGMGILALYSLASYIRLWRRVRTAVRLEASVYVSEFADTPFVLGIVRPRIYLPAGMPEELRGPVLAHERAHLRRRDNLWKMAGYVLRCVYWFHPLIWVAYALFCRDMELACDESVIKEYDTHKRRMYSEALLACSFDRHAAFRYPLAFGEVGVRERIRSVIQYKKPAFWAATAAVAGCIAVAICFLTDPIGPGEDFGDAQLLSAEADGEAEEDGAGGLESRYAAADGSETKQGGILDGQDGDGADKPETTSASGDSAQEGSMEEGSAEMEAEDRALLETLVSEWIEAFVNRDGNAIQGLASEGVAYALESRDMLSGLQGQRSFGLSSPWPEDADKDAAVYEITPEYAIILYYVRTSEPHVTVWKERIFYRKQDGGYVVTREELTWLDDISTWKEYSEAYGYFGIDGTAMDYETNGLGEELNSKALRSSDTAYQDLFQPERAARRLLNLDASKVKLERIYEGPGEINFYVWFPGEEDSHRSLTMTQPYGRDGIWIPKDRRVDVIARFRRIDWDEIRDRNMILVNEPGRWNHVVLIAELPEEGIRLYGYNDVEWSYKGVAVEIGEEVSYYDWDYTTDWQLLPECHWNGEKRQLQVALNSYVGHNAAAQALHVLEYDDYGVLYESGWLELEDMQEMLQDRIGYSIVEETGQLRLFDKRDQKDLGTVDLGVHDAEGFGLELGMFSSFSLGEDIKLLVEPVYCQKDIFLVERPDDMPTLEVEILLRGGNGNRRLVDFGEIKCIPGGDETRNRNGG